jgi:transposase InsO family protein
VVRYEHDAPGDLLHIVQRVLTDNGSPFRSKQFARNCSELGIRHKFTRPYRPQTNGKAERFIQSALREWTYGFTYQHSSRRTAALDYWNHHYNWTAHTKAPPVLLPCLVSTSQETTS